MSISTVSTDELLLRNVYWDWVKGSLFGIHKVRFAKVELTKDLKGKKRDLNIRPESTRIRFIQWPVLIGFTVCQYIHASQNFMFSYNVLTI